MKLFLDSSTGVCKIWIKGSQNDLYYEKELNRDMARDILGFIKECLQKNGLDWQDIAGLGVFAGPGSFTGLRIGITVLNTLSDGLKIPIVSSKNSDNSKTGEGMDDWLEAAKLRLSAGENDKIALPFYGADANITKPRK